MDLSPDEDNFPGRLFHQAALWDNAELLTDLLRGDGGCLLADAADARGRTALHAAAVSERSRCLTALLEAGADPNKQCDEASGGKTPLHIAAERGHAENIRILVTAGALVGTCDAAGRTPLDVAERAGHRYAANALREARDAAERVRVSRHAILRETLLSGALGKLRETLTTNISMLGAETGIVVNMTPGGADTLLYVASEIGWKFAVKALLEAGADGRAHPVTRYSPLYIASYHGHVHIVQLLLLNTPELARQETVEKWLPLHAACIGGHATIVSTLLTYNYPETILQTYTDPSGQWHYRAPFDVNHPDFSGQTALYVACTLGNIQIVEILLEHTVPAVKIQSQEPEDKELSWNVPPSDGVLSPVQSGVVQTLLSPTKKRISDGIQSIMSKLTRQTSLVVELQDANTGAVKPVSVVGGCTGDTCVGAAVRRCHIKVLQRLLKAGADPNAACRDTDELTQTSSTGNRVSRARSSSAFSRRGASPSPSPCRVYTNTKSTHPYVESVVAGSTTPLALAARSREQNVVELLLSAGAVDSGGLALREAARNADEPTVCKLLSVKAYADPEYKINKRAMPELPSARVPGSPGSATLTYSSLYPTTPVMLNWTHTGCGLGKIRVRWLSAGVLHVNPRLLSPSSALHALTRVDLSSNALQQLPLALFQLTSLRYLNAAQNKLERLPTFLDPSDCNDPTPSHDIKNKRRLPKQRSRDGALPELIYTAPVLEEIYLQDNRLEDLPDMLFCLPSLNTLDVSNNKLRTLPSAMWRSPRLRDLNAALNLLRDLPDYENEKAKTDVSPSTLLSPSDSCSSENRLSTSSSGGNIAQLIFGTQMKSASRSPSVDRGLDCQTVEEQASSGNAMLPHDLINRTRRCTELELRKQHAWQRSLEVREEGVSIETEHSQSARSRLAQLNLAHNQFASMPAGLACLAPALTRLNLAYNSLRSMSYVTSYPNALRQLDLSHNQISCWPSLPQVEALGVTELSHLSCQCPGSLGVTGGRRPRSGCSVRCAVLNAVCPAKRHLRLEGLRTLILADNLLTRIQLTTDDEGVLGTAAPSTVSVNSNASDENDEWNLLPTVKTRLLFPNLSMLDVSNNMLRAIPPAIHELSNLSVLNISGNNDITELPPQMGLLSRLWNLNTSGCPLQEPLRSMIESKKYKTMDIVGYLKSVLEDAQPYARMKLMVVGVQGIGKTSLLECLRQESAPGLRKKGPEHWSKRMGNKSAGAGTRTARGVSVSTVGVDIGDWVYEKHASVRGPITFRTWDFGGQQEYYATHQYFLSRRALYVCVWRAVDGRAGLSAALRWLRSVQARAPGACAVLVATHYDKVHSNNLADGDTPESLQRLIRSRIIGVADADKLGLPRVLDSLEVSCKTRHNVRLLADILYDAAFSLKPPGSKESMLEQRVPATYLALEECVAHIVIERKAKGLDPVLKHDQYKQQVTQFMQQKFHRSFRDQAELHQATMFLHENGVLLHYDDATLKDLYFLDPQWLCDMLAHVVTVREINPFAKNGIMKLDDLQHVFRAWDGGSEEARALAVSLLNKFELALPWEGRALLLPPLLPATESDQLRLPLRARHWSWGRMSSCPGGGARVWMSPLSALAADCHSTGGENSGINSPKLYGNTGVTVWGRSSPERALRRLLIMSYVPAGFWPRLIARVLADDTALDVLASYYQLPRELSDDGDVVGATQQPGAWQPWQCGLRLLAGDITLASVREVRLARDDVLAGGSDQYTGVRFRLKQDGAWCDLETGSSAIVEVFLPLEVLVIKKPVIDDDGEPMGYQNISVEPSPEASTKLLAMLTDHVDLLLEDWYPTLGTRFVHTSEGRCLVTRVVACPCCLRDCNSNIAMTSDDNRHQDLHMQLSAAFKRSESSPAVPVVRVSQDSRASDVDSGVDAESTASSRLPSVEGVLIHEENEDTRPAYAWTIEECILAACGGPNAVNLGKVGHGNTGTGHGSVKGSVGSKAVNCPIHGDIMLADIAPDTIFLDIASERVARGDSIQRGRLLGRGAFGLVFRATWVRPGYEGAHTEVALKVLQPVHPGAHARPSALAAYKAGASRWCRDPAAGACRAYCGARQELSVLGGLRHPHVVPLLAVCPAPLALLLDLAPMGALDALLVRYRGCGVRVGVRAARALALQTARALEYLHTRRIVYRDLKAENVLVWKAPRPEEAVAAERSTNPINVHVKLADYGISRLTLPSGTKGFGGTEGFMAPEIMRYNGEEEYTEKVDCFSYGMFLYEVLTLRQPYEGHEAVKEAILEGGRPPLTPKDTQYPCYMLDVMSLCWSNAPELRPSSSQLVSLGAAPEFARLHDVLHAAPECGACAQPLHRLNDEGECELWWGGAGNRLHLLLATPTTWTRHYTVKLPTTEQDSSDDTISVSAICPVGNEVWVGDSRGNITAYAVSDCSVLWTRGVEAAVGGDSGGAGVSSMLALPVLARLAVALKNGRLFLVTTELLQEEESFVLTELGAASALYCLTGVQVDNMVWEVWCGGAAGTVWSYGVGQSGPREATQLSHPISTANSTTQGIVTHLASAGFGERTYVFSYVQPGCVVYQWSVFKKTILARLDCSKLVPCSESLKSISIEEHLTPGRCQVTALTVLGEEVYMGTAWGCIIVAEVRTLRPITIFRPYEREVMAIVPLDWQALSKTKEGDGSNEERFSMVATLGRGYRSLLSRYTDTPQSSNTSSNASSTGTYCLLWRADNWAAD